MHGPARWRVVLAAACTLLASCASEPVVTPTNVEFRPAPRSTLATRRDLDFFVAKWQSGAESTTLLARKQDGAAPRPVARLLQVRQGPELHLAVQQLPQAWSAADHTDHEIAAVEQLYALVLRQEPKARYCLGSGAGLCDAARDGVSHPQVLQALADLRERAVVRAPAALPWQVVRMQGTPTRSGDADVVSVRATGPQGPLEDVAIYFNRPPHSICAAHTRADGVATCRLEDQHGDGDQHDHATVVVATFPGDVRPDRVLLPTTYVLPTTADSLPPAFARPLSLPTGKP
ncbi:MAG: hypothetical protein Q7T97_16785 [Burkholderiaceae bacterium]|nr:hypothetical protein [Burkholderiaceae bacterium]